MQNITSVRIGFCVSCDFNDIYIPPVWATIEVFDMGDICNLCARLSHGKKYKEVTKQITIALGFTVE